MAILGEHKRSQVNGSFRPDAVGKSVVVFGWVQSYRDHGGVVFIDLRDRSGFVQLRCEPTPHAEAHRLANLVRSEWVIAARGTVISRGDNVNPKIPTGAIEIAVEELEILSEAQTPPFEIRDGIETNENTRLTYRYLDLRRPELNNNFVLRSKAYQITRQYFTGEQGLSSWKRRS